MRTDQDEQQIREVIATWMAATAVGDLSQILNLMTEDVVFLLPAQSPMRGREAFATNFRGALQHVRLEATSDIQEILVAGNLAYCWNKLVVSMIPLNGGPAKKHSGSTLSILRKEADGQWRLFRDANLLSEA